MLSTSTIHNSLGIIKVALLSLLLTLCAGTFSNAAPGNNDTNAVFKNANELYQKGKYKEAIEEYKDILMYGYEAPELYFNMANAYYRSGLNSQAILNYERAKKLAPSDADIQFNLKVANLKVVDKMNVLPQLFYVRWWNSTANLFSADQWTFITIGASWITFLMALLFFIVKSRLLKRIFFFACLISFFSSIALDRKSVV